MLEQFIKKLSSDLTLEINWDAAKKEAKLFLSNKEVMIQQQDPGLHFRSIVFPLSSLNGNNVETIFTQLMHGNLMGQATGGGVLGISSDEQYITFLLQLSYQLDYPAFKEQLETFVNYLLYWQQEILALEQKTGGVI